jgi:hypothetical protein
MTGKIRELQWIEINVNGMIFFNNKNFRQAEILKSGIHRTLNDTWFHAVDAAGAANSPRSLFLFEILIPNLCTKD